MIGFNSLPNHFLKFQLSSNPLPERVFIFKTVHKASVLHGKSGIFSGLAKEDTNAITTIEIAAYHNISSEGCAYIICKSNKQVAWGIAAHNALQIHDMYTRIHILHEDNSEPDEDAKIKKMRLSPQNNGFLHNWPEEVVAER